jgi:hypothetical protein
MLSGFHNYRSTANGAQFPKCLAFLAAVSFLKISSATSIRDDSLDIFYATPKRPIVHMEED